MAKKDVVVKKAAAAAVAAKNAASKDGETETVKKPTTVKLNTKLAHSYTDVVNAVNSTYDNYLKTLTPRLKLIDIFLTFLVALGALQFVYVLLVGNFPFNAFLGGFIACVGQFVLTVSLRMQYASIDSNATSNAKKDDEEEEVPAEKPFFTISPERAFGDFIFASLILHFIVFHFIN
ncbi:hypothetical protein JCM33374_g1318 [Metschnikowia sp. JCM 33374]|nr:hypothetical protein JCM33374_g1318 [Metschnikowia sp. JCM 33374]